MQLWVLSLLFLFILLDTCNTKLEKFKNIDYDNYNASGWNKVVYIGNKYNNLSLFI